MDNSIKKVSPSKARKRPNNYNIKIKRKKEESTKIRYSTNQPPIKPTCGHNTKAYQCSKLNSNDVLHFNRVFYATKDKIKQDNLILKHVVSTDIKRRRPKTGNKPGRFMALKYFIRKKKDKTLIPVCKKAFLGILNLKKGRIDGVAKRHYITGAMAVENRGGDRKTHTYRSRQEAVEKFILKLQPLEIHYCRDKVRQRQYLHPELNIKKLWKMYSDEELPGFSVSFSFFRKIFTTKFNIGFGSPRQDVCSTCLQLKEKTKVENNPNQKVKLMTEMRIHKLRAKAFFKLLQKEEENEILLSFDCQKNLPLPKIPDQSVYYSRQLYLYNFTIVKGSSHDNLSKDNVFSYTWTEETSHKGSNEICSAIIDCLNKLNTNGIEKIRLMADGCGGQNKNYILLTALMNWLHLNSRNVKSVEVIFPVTGHSFLPPDRVFALTERRIRKMEAILTPAEYLNVFKEHATVFHLGTDIPIFDYKTQSRNVLKSTQSLHFQITKCKRFIITLHREQFKIRGEMSYYSDTGVDKTINKRGQSFLNFRPERLPIGVPIKEAKLTDVRKLLETHFGQDWASLQQLNFYKKVLNTQNVLGRPMDEEDIEEDDSEELLNFV